MSESLRCPECGSWSVAKLADHTKPALNRDGDTPVKRGWRWCQKCRAEFTLDAARDAARLWAAPWTARNSSPNRPKP